MSPDEQLACKTPGCPNTILATTAARTAGTCRPCEQRFAREQHAEFVRANRREVDPYDGVTDVVQIVKILLRDRVYDELVIEKPFPQDVGDYFASLRPEDVDRLITLAVSLISARTHAADDLAVYLATFTTADLQALQRARLAAECLHPGVVFRNAPEDVRDQLIDRTRPEANPLDLNHTLVALAWIGDDSVVRLFAGWQVNPPGWRSKLHVSPSDYSWEAGWEISPSGSRRDLYFSPAIALVPSTTSSVLSGVAVATEASGTCMWCGGPLTCLLQCGGVDHGSAISFLPEQVVTCAQCTCYDHIFMRLDAVGTPAWHEANRRPSFLPDEAGQPLVARVQLVPGHTRGALHACYAFPPTTVSQLGGAPGWVQDADYPRCPDCRAAMPFVGQVSPEEVLGSPEEGTYYLFWCAECRVTATGYQQT